MRRGRCSLLLLPTRAFRERAADDGCHGPRGRALLRCQQWRGERGFLRFEPLIIVHTAAVAGCFGTGGALPGAALLRHARVRQAHELVEHGELELQLDGVQHGLEGRFADVVVRVFEPHQDGVHGEADAVDDDELDHDRAGARVVDGPEQADRVHDVDGADGELLDAEHRQLDPLHDVEDRRPLLPGAAVAADREHDRRRVQEDPVSDDHGEHQPQRSLSPYHQMQT